MNFNALVLAGSRGGIDPVASYASVTDKALISIGGKTMLQHVVTQLRDAGAARIAVSASSSAVKVHAAELGAEVIDAAPGPSLSALEGLRQLNSPMLVTTADHALLKCEWIREFLRDVPRGADVCALLATRAAIERDGPGTRRTYLRFSDGDWSGCNLFYCATPAAGRAISLWASVEADRKRPWKIVRRFGATTLTKYLLGRLCLAEAISKLGDVTGSRAAIVESRSGLAAVDVDSPEDLDFVRQIQGLVNAPGAFT